MTVGLFDQINRLRALAAALFDQGRASGLTKEQVSERIEPMRKTLDGVIQEAARDSLASCVVAINQFHSHNEALARDIQFLNEKIMDNESYMERIKKELKKRMLVAEVNYLEEGGFSATLVETVDGLSVEVR
jgi:predicted  nucleic acid-binding Zn-ribbon protein